MSIIQLSEETASKIAAGEVVERPVSVVKELIENAIDANASQIQVRIEKAGMRLIEVSDDGEGIPADEVKLALHRYATSKITSLDDLETIHSLGFRGEALASIAAVSRFLIRTNTRLQQSGVEMSMEGGSEKSFSSAGLPVGTIIRVEDLFFNTPARRKFLKKEITEKRLIADLVSRFALFYAHIRFVLRIEGRETLLTSGKGDRLEILSQIYDLDTAKKLLAINLQEHDVEIQGFTSPVGLSRSSRKDIFFFINGRLISDASLTSAVTRAYHDLLMVGRFPLTILFLSIPPREMDVNVHPAKAEVRFENPGKFFNIIHQVIRKTVTLHIPQSSFSPAMWITQGSGGTTADPAWEFSTQYPESNSYFDARQGGSDTIPGQAEVISLPILRSIGQIGRKYIVAEGPDGLYLIDQHAAHERILFEKMVNNGSQPTASQFLLAPMQIQVNDLMDQAMRDALPILLNLGFKISEFGTRVYRVDAVPEPLQHIDPKDALLSALEADMEDQYLDGELNRKIISRVCKRAAIKAGQVISPQEQETLIRDLESCQSPRTCPHGRPTMIHLSVDVLERQFGRR
jgi:DNA mismatch repair protein MutL